MKETHEVEKGFQTLITSDLAAEDPGLAGVVSQPWHYGVLIWITGSWQLIGCTGNGSSGFYPFRGQKPCDTENHLQTLPSLLRGSTALAENHCIKARPLTMEGKMVLICVRILVTQHIETWFH